MSSQDWNQTLDNQHKYQVWIKSWPADRTPVESEPGHMLIGQHNTIEEAARDAIAHEDYRPVITKVVTYKTVIMDITEAGDDS